MSDRRIRAMIGNPYADVVQNVFLCSVKNKTQDLRDLIANKEASTEGAK